MFRHCERWRGRRRSLGQPIQSPCKPRWIASSLALLAMTVREKSRSCHLRGAGFFVDFHPLALSLSKGVVQYCKPPFDKLRATDLFPFLVGRTPIIPNYLANPLQSD